MPPVNNFVLQQNSDPTTTNWLDVTNSPVVVSNRRAITGPVSGRDRIHRRNDGTDTGRGHGNGNRRGHHHGNGHRQGNGNGDGNGNGQGNGNAQVLSSSS